MATRRIAVVGGGTSGSIVATWLAHNSDHEIIVFEPGPQSRHDDTPGFFDVLRDESLQSMWEVRLVEDGPVIPYVQARALGGGSAINGMLLTGEVPDVADGFAMRPKRVDAVGEVGSALVDAGGRVSELWWNDCRWNPGRPLAHLAGASRVRVVESHVDSVIVEAGLIRGVHWAESVMEVDAVVMCAGALRTPLVLLASGLGSLAPGIGHGLQDHPSVTFAVERLQPSSSLLDAAVVLESEAVSGARHLIIGYERASWMEPELGLVSVALMTPRSRGRVALVGGEPLVEFSMLSVEHDIVAMREGVRRLCALSTSDSFGHRFAAVYADDAGHQVQDLMTMEDIELDRWIRLNLRPVHHATSSCSAVLNQDRSIPGVANLWIADASALASVPPVTPAGPVTMEAGKVARIIGEALG